MINAPSPTGPAGGDLSGTYPDPAIAANAVTMDKIDTSGVLSGQAIMFDGSLVRWQTPPNPGGTITGVTAGAGLNGGGTSGDVTLSVDFAGSGSASTATRSDHGHAGEDITGAVTKADTAEVVPWSGLTDIPSGFADGVDNTGGDAHSLDAADGDPIDAVFVDNVGFVGIGTTSPEDVFTISKTLQGPDEPETETLTLIPGSTGRGNPASFVTSFPHVRFITPANISVNGSGVTDVSITTKNTNVLDKLVVGSSGSVSGPVGSASLAGNVSIGGNLTVNGGQVVNVNSETTGYTTTTSDRVILYVYDGGDGGDTIYLHDSGDSPGQLLSIRLKSSAAYVDIGPSTGDTIDGVEAIISLGYGGEYPIGVTLVSDVTGWWIVSTALQMVYQEPSE